MVDANQDFYMRISAYADHPHEPHGSATAWPTLVVVGPWVDKGRFDQISQDSTLVVQNIRRHSLTDGKLYKT